jgi:hypothetical protein
MSTAVSRTPRKVSSRTLQRLEALRQTFPPVYQAASEIAPLPDDGASNAQYEFAWSLPDIADTQSPPQRLPGTPWNRGRIVGPYKPKI